MNEAITINGTEYTVTRPGQTVIQMKGPRGRVACLGRNLKSGAWFFQLGSRMERISSIQAPATFPQFASVRHLENGWVLPA